MTSDGELDLPEFHDLERVPPPPKPRYRATISVEVEYEETLEYDVPDDDDPEGILEDDGTMEDLVRQTIDYGYSYLPMTRARNIEVSYNNGTTWQDWKRE